LREAGAQEKTIPNCLTWVRQFFARHPGRRRRDLGRQEIEAFLAELVASRRVDNWQVQQARNALELYYERFRGIALAPRPDARMSPVGQPAPASPPAADHRPCVHEAPQQHAVHYTARTAETSK